MQKISKIWIWIFAVTLALLCVGGVSRFLHASVVDVLFPLENGVTWVRRGIVRRVTPFFKAQAVLARVDALEDEVERLRLDASLLAGISEENRELRRQLRLPPAVMRVPERCLPVSWGGALGWWQSARVNKGKTSGIAVGDAVVTAEGLVGRIRSVTEHTAEVEFVTDPNCRIACSLDLPEGMPSARGIVQGAGWKAGTGDVPGFLYVCEPLRLDYLARDFQAGDGIPARTRVVTSGLSGTIPGGLTVGWLVDSGTEPNGLYKTGKVLPAVDFANIRTMFVLVAAGRSP